MTCRNCLGRVGTCPNCDHVPRGRWVGPGGQLQKHHPRPPATGLTTQRWIDEVPVIHIPVGAVLPTQDVDPAVVAAKVLDKYDSHTDDPYGHVVVVQGRWLIEDGHHRHAAAVARGDAWWPARVYVHPGAAA